MFSLLSLNTFGVPFYLSIGRIKRLTAELNKLAPMVICLQEIQQNAYLALLKHGLTGNSQHAFFRNRLAPKGGLFIASTSASMMKKSEFYPYPNQGRPLSIGFSDWALNKGVLLVNMEFQKHSIIVMNTHLQANYLGDWRLSNHQTQIQRDQVKFLVELIHAQKKDAWVIVCGDFNFPRQAPAYQQMSLQSGLIDAFADDPQPTYLPFPLVSSKWRTSLDYIFYRIPAGEDADVTADIIPIVNSTTKMPLKRFLTDHYALSINLF
jgi:endonuclease/exonuclease/phosphatase family metal-dependent hydrolase